MNILYLTVTKQWFDMIMSGDKQEEYRTINEYWFNRLILMPQKIIQFFNIKDMDSQVEHILTGKYKDMIAFKPFDAVHFRNGYRKESPTVLFQCKGIEVNTGNEKWGAEKDRKYFVIKLGSQISKD